jgi:hypothetical protein
MPSAGLARAGRVSPASRHNDPWVIVTLPSFDSRSLAALLTRASRSPTDNLALLEC